jgi:hypothetical protein
MITRRNHKAVAGFLPLIILTLVLLCGAVTSHAFEITIDVAPNVLNLGSSGTVVTVHTDISYAEVEVGANDEGRTELLLNDIPISWWKADNCGNFVAKFTMNDIKNLPLDIGEYNIFKLVGTTVDGDGFIGLQEILVIDNLPAGK